MVNTIADGLYQLDSIVSGQHPKLQTSELEVWAFVWSWERRLRNAPKLIHTYVALHEVRTVLQAGQGPEKGEERPNKAKSSYPKGWERFWKLNNGVPNTRSVLLMQKWPQNLHLHRSSEAGWWETPALITPLQRWFSLAPKGLKHLRQATSVSCWG